MRGYMSGSKREKRMASEQQYQALFEREQTYKNDVENLSRRLDELSRQVCVVDTFFVIKSPDRSHPNQAR